MAKEPLGLDETEYPEYEVKLQVTRRDSDDLDKDGEPKEITVFQADKIYFPHRRWNRIFKEWEEVEHLTIKDLLSSDLFDADTHVQRDECEVLETHEFDPNDPQCLICGMDYRESSYLPDVDEVKELSMREDN